MNRFIISYPVKFERQSNLENPNSYPGIKLIQNCDHEEFYKAAVFIENLLRVEFFNKVNDYDSFFLDFRYKSCVLTLHHNVFLGVSIYPANCWNYGLDDEKALEEIYQSLTDVTK